MILFEYPFSLITGCAIFLFIGWMGFLVLRYIFLLITRPKEKQPFPWAALIVFILCCGFYAIAFINDFGDQLFSNW